MPNDETTAISFNSLIGRVAIIILGEAKKGYPAQAKVKDAYGKYHYIMVEPDIETETFSEGTAVLLVRRVSNIFYVIALNNEKMQVQL